MMRREVSCEGDRGKATRVATRFDAVCEITDEHFAGPKLRLMVDKHGRWWLHGWTGTPGTHMELLASGEIAPTGMVTMDESPMA